MASTIDTTSIDAEYPVAGIDNDSQGFRDNFNSIKTNLTTAGSEITLLQANRARIDADNNHVGNEIQDAVLLQVTEKFNNSNQTITADHEVDYRDAHIHQFNATAPAGNIMTVTFVGWPANRYAKVRCIMSVSSGSSTAITIAADPGSDVKTNSAVEWVSNAAASPWSGGNILTHSGSLSEKIIVDVSTYNGGADLYAEFIGRVTS